MYKQKMRANFARSNSNWKKYRQAVAAELAKSADIPVDSSLEDSDAPPSEKEVPEAEVDKGSLCQTK